MPTIAEATQQLATDEVPVLFMDTCVLLDIIRAPLRNIRHCIRSAVELSEVKSHSGYRIVASSMIQNEWNAHERDVTNELNRHLAACDQHAFEFHEACEFVKLSIAFGKPSYRAAGLAEKLRDLAADLLKNAIHLSPSEEAKSKATNRTLACERPGRNGGGLQDCIIIEEYLELCRQLHAKGFAKAMVFCSSNTKDYEEDGKLHESLAAEFGAVGLTFTKLLHWAIHELKKS